jgi:cytoskeletal protein CcmA (bactofilin family)
VEATEKVDIRKDGRLKGDIKTSRIVIEDGAVFKGAIDIVKSEPKAAPPPPKPQAAAAAMAATPAQQEVKR